MALDFTAVLEFVVTQTNPKDLSTPTDALEYLKQVLLTDGTSVDQADLIYHDTLTIAASGTGNLDLSGVLVSPLTGATLAFVEICAVAVFASSANTNNVVMGNASNPFIGWFGAAAHTESIKPGGVSIHIARDNPAWAVTAATADILGMANSGAGTGVTYDIIIVGRSA